jgi:hypothetical protein
MDPNCTIFLGNFHGKRIGKDSRAYLLSSSLTLYNSLQANVGKSLYLPNREKLDSESREENIIALLPKRGDGKGSQLNRQQKNLRGLLFYSILSTCNFYL